jgi:hypothetical protein
MGLDFKDVELDLNSIFELKLDSNLANKRPENMMGEVVKSAFS